MQELTLTNLLALHIRMLAGSYLDGGIERDGSALYVWSAGIPDVTMNFASGIGAGGADWALRAAARRDREAAILTDDRNLAASLRRHPRFEASYPAAWMVLEEPERAMAAALPADLSIVAQAPPQPGFLQVFTQAFPDEAVNAHVARYYATALSAARTAGAQSCEELHTSHFLLSDEAGPAACATIHRLGRAAGLYNVGTHHARQGRGLGSAVVSLAIRHALSRGCEVVFLQCAAGTHLERMYGRLGFRTAISPELMCFGKA
jgi:GNAT superfamily N-acetyltransferase